MPIFKARKTAMFLFALCVLPIFGGTLCHQYMAGGWFNKFGSGGPPGLER
jgi:hypothetical protein